MSFVFPNSGPKLKAPLKADSSHLFKRYGRLTMPAGALDALMQPTLKILAQRAQQSEMPLQVGFLLFAGDHAVARRYAVSAYPPEVTPQMVANIVAGGAAISQLAARRDATLMVCDVGVAAGFENILGLRPAGKILFERKNLHQHFPDGGYHLGSRDITQTSALSESAYRHCWNAGVQCVDELLSKTQCDVIALGEMGIGNTTAASTVAALVLSLPVEECVGRGTGLDDAGIKRKTEVVAAAVRRASGALSVHEQGSLAWAHSVLLETAGAELSALAGAAWRAAERGVMVLLDGVIVTAAVSPLADCDPAFTQWLLASHESAEQIHKTLLSRLNLRPLLQLGLRLGEGSGAALAAGLLQDADALLRNMATFDSAGVSSS
ncbi:MAG: nicotinate-nucleotide--dimethylbenzimidazole phosphoribosyltransferase [Pseudomonadota bacterium]|jgi:nicotinate-nucleotide--dimethylbenzimidazole phosphoribosyltransferase